MTLRQNGTSFLEFLNILASWELPLIPFFIFLKDTTNESGTAALEDEKKKTIKGHKAEIMRNI